MSMLVVCEVWRPDPGCGSDGTTLMYFYKLRPESDSTIRQLLEVPKDDRDEYVKHYCIEPGQSLWTQDFCNAYLSCCGGYFKTNFFFDIKDALSAEQHDGDTYFQPCEHTYKVMLEKAEHLSTEPFEEVEVGRSLTDCETKMIKKLGSAILQASTDHRFSDIPLIQKQIADIQKVMF